MRELRTTSIKLPVLFILLSGIPVILLGWFAWRLIEQERTLETQRLKERLANAAVLITQEFDREIAARENLLAKAGEGLAEIPPDLSFIVLTSEGVIRHSGIRLAYYPRLASTEAPEAVTAGEIEEFRDGNCSRASQAYRKLSASTNPATRAGGLVRLARCLRKLDQTQEALVVYGELARLSDAPAAGDPAELVAYRERISLFKQIRDNRSEQHETALLREALSSGRFAIDRSTFTFYAEVLDEPLPLPLRMQLAQATEALWPLLEQRPSGRQVWKGKDMSVVAVWRQVPAGEAGFFWRGRTPGSTGSKVIKQSSGATRPGRFQSRQRYFGNQNISRNRAALDDPGFPDRRNRRGNSMGSTPEFAPGGFCTNGLCYCCCELCCFSSGHPRSRSCTSPVGFRCRRFARIQNSSNCDAASHGDARRR